MPTNRHRRSGISSLIGAIFFVLVVFLVFTSTVLIFQNFSGYAGSLKQVDSQDLQNKNTLVAVSDLAFGGVSTYTGSTIYQSVPNTQSAALLPIQNMNFTTGMSGWVFSRGYELSLHNGTVTNYPQNILPGLDVFSLGVSDTDAATSYVVGLSLVVSSGFRVPPSYQQPTPPNPNWVVSVAGNVIQWTLANPAICTDGVLSGAGPTLFAWSAVAPPVLGPYLHDITLTWQNFPGGACSPQKDLGTATLTTTVVTTNVGGTDTEKIASEPPGTIPGGSFGGYDSVSSNIGSESGPGSVFLSFQPTFNGQPITTTTQGGNLVPEQLTSELNLTTYFNLPAPVDLASASYGACAVAPAGCPVFSFGYSLDHAVSGEPPLIFISAYLTYLPTDGVKQIINDTALDLGNNGWIMNNVPFSVLASLPNPIETIPGTLPAGEYQLSVSVTATMFGDNPPSPNYPPSLLMHFDDIGLAFPEAGASSWCVDTAASSSSPCAPTFYSSDLTGGASLPCNYSPGFSCGLNATLPEIPMGSSVAPGEIQSLTFTAGVAVTSPGGVSTAYAFLEDAQASPSGPAWVELGQVTFTSRADIQASIPASTASKFLDEFGGLCTAPTGPDAPGSSCIRIYATSASGFNFGSLSVSITLTAQTFQQQEAAVEVTNNSTTPVHVVSVFVSGVNQFGQSGDNGNTTSLAPLLGPGGSGIWLASGQTTTIQIGLGLQSGVVSSAECGAASTTPNSLKCFSWTTGQSYLVTVTTDSGLIFTATFVSP